MFKVTGSSAAAPWRCSTCSSTSDGPSCSACPGRLYSIWAARRRIHLATAGQTVCTALSCACGPLVVEEQVAGSTEKTSATPDEILAAHYASTPHVAAQLQKRPATGSSGRVLPTLRGASEPACLDYAYSFITHPGPLNAVRFCTSQA